jgi:glycosyltransferase involved in cell wall biosynthesis
MKLLSVAVPCFNSEDYMEHCVQTLVSGGTEVEVIIVNDGSTDRTQEIAKKLQSDYPDIVKVIYQENGGHGEAVNTGLKNAAGAFFKVVDSDDWVDETALKKVLNTLRYMIENNKGLDMLLANFVYDKQGAHHKKVMKYNGVFMTKRLTHWDGYVHFRKSQYILMHSVIYRTELLRECGLQLPKHTFYVDNIFVFHPLPYVKKLCYIDVDLYHYFIGREDQSVNEQVMISRIDQHIRVTKIMIEDYLSMEIESSHLNKYMLQYLSMMMCIASVMLILSGTEEALEEKKALWNWLKEQDETLYRKLRRSLLGVWMNLPGRAGRKLSVTGYKATKKIFGFN